MAITVGVNTWITVVEADALISFEVGAESWFDLVDDATGAEPSKELYLVSAYRWLSAIYAIPASSTLANVKLAQAKAAVFLLTDYEENAKLRALHSAGVNSMRQSRYSVSLGEESVPWGIASLVTSFGSGLINLEAISE